MKFPSLLRAIPALLLLLPALAVSRASAGVIASEPPDFPSTAGPALAYGLVQGSNVFSGTLPFATGDADYFKAVVPSGLVVTQIYTTGGVITPPSPLPLYPGTNTIAATGQSLSDINWSITFVALPADYALTTSGGQIILTDLTGAGDTLTVSEPLAGKINFAAPGRIFLVNGTNFLTNNSGDLSLGGINGITVNAGGGNNTVNVGGFSGSTFPHLTINGGTGNDAVNFLGNLTFDLDKSLTVDLQDDGISPGVDSVYVAPNVHLATAAFGTIIIRCSRNVWFDTGAVVQTGYNSLIVEANQQEPPTAGNFLGVMLNGASLYAGGGLFTISLTVKGRGGNDPGGNQLGVQVINGGSIVGASGVAVSVSGTGGASSGIVNRGITVYGAGSSIKSFDQLLTIDGRAGQIGGEYGIGVSVLFGGEIVGANGGITLSALGAGAPGSRDNQGLELGGTGSRIATADGFGGPAGDISISGRAGPGTSYGVLLANSGTIFTPANHGNINLQADSVSLDATAVISNAWPQGLVQFATTGSATQIDLGGADAPGTLALTDAELDRVSTSTLVLAGSGPGSITISGPITRSNTADMVLIPGSGGLRATTAGTDISLGTRTLALLGPLVCPITGPTADTDYPQLRVAGVVYLTGASLNLSNTTYAGAPGLSFTVVRNDGPNAITGAFTGLPEGATIVWPGSPQLNARISYAGGDGNDAVLTLVSPLTVTVTNDSGPGSLRNALAYAAATNGANTITFAPSLAGQTLTPTNEIVINDTGGVTIDATSLTNGLTISGNHAKRIFSVATNSGLTLQGLTLTGGNGSGDVNGGGAAYDGFGGAIVNQGTLTLAQCTLSGNSATNNGGYGGVIYNRGGILAMTNCTLTANSATAGGAIYNNFLATATLTHCTLAFNRATGTGADGGGGVDNFNSTLTLNACLVAGNTAATTNGPDFWMEFGTLTTRNSLIGIGASSTVTNGVNGNLVGTTAAPIDARLLPLGNYGGPTFTMPPRADSPAVDAAPTSMLTTDQRGVSRPIDGELDGIAAADIGAVEFNNLVAVTTTADQLDSPAGAQLSLREALRDAPEGSLIYFPPPAFTPAAHTITLSPALGELVVAKGLSVVSTNGVIINAAASSGDQRRVFEIATNGQATFKGLNITGGYVYSGFGGGGILNRGSLNVIGCQLTGNTALYGAAASSYSGSGATSLTLRQCTVSGNTALGNGGGLLNWAVGGHAANLDVEACAVTGNSAGAGVGGGVLNFASEGAATALLRACTVAGNQAGFGAGAYNYSAASTATGFVTVVHCTISSNAATGLGGGLYDRRDGGVTHTLLGDTIVAGNTAPNPPAGPDLYSENSSFFSTGNNLIGKADGASANWQVGFNSEHLGTAAAPLDPVLAPPGNYGGPTMTMALMPGSPAREAALNSTAVTDQRGFPIVDVADIGAYEAGSYVNYAAWSWENFPTNATVLDRAPTTDYDHDGMANAMEYASQGNPLVSNSSPALTLTFNTARTAATNAFAVFYNATDLFYQLDRSTNLAAGWSPMSDFDTKSGNAYLYLGGTSLRFLSSSVAVADRTITNRPQTFYRLRISFVP